MSETVEAEQQQGVGPQDAADAGVAQLGDAAEEVESEGVADGDIEDDGGDDVLVREGDIAGDYLERLLDLLDFDGDIDLDVEAGRAVISVDGGEDLERLVGSRGQVLEALQELTRLAVQQETAGRSRLMLDIGGWRADRREELRQLGTRTAEKVVAEGERVRLQPMSPFERKVVHDAVAAVEGAQSESEGEEPKRRVVVLPE